MKDKIQVQDCSILEYRRYCNKILYSPAAVSLSNLWRTAQEYQTGRATSFRGRRRRRSLRRRRKGIVSKGEEAPRTRRRRRGEGAKDEAIDPAQQPLFSGAAVVCPADFLIPALSLPLTCFAPSHCSAHAQGKENSLPAISLQGTKTLHQLRGKCV